MSDGSSCASEKHDLHLGPTLRIEAALRSPRASPSVAQALPLPRLEQPRLHAPPVAQNETIESCPHASHPVRSVLPAPRERATVVRAGRSPLGTDATSHQGFGFPLERL